MTVPAVDNQRERLLVLGFCLTLLTVACGREAWAYVEARRFNRTVEAIVVRDEPTSLYQAVQHPTGRTQQNAAQHYVAAAELVVTRREWISANTALLGAARAGDLGDAATRRLNATFVRENIAALELLAQARLLEFHGFNRAGRFPSVPISRLLPLLSAAAFDRIERGAGDGSFSVITDLVATRKAYASAGSLGVLTLPVDRAALLVGLTVRHAPPSPDALRTLAAALASSAADDDLAPYFLRDRARFIDDVGRHLRTGAPLTDTNRVLAFMVRPWHRHRVNQALVLLTELVDAARRPWPERLTAIDALIAGIDGIGHRTGGRGPLGLQEEAFALGLHQLVGRHVAKKLAVTSALRAAVAVELHRGDRGALPVSLAELADTTLFSDPMTGDQLRYRSDAGGYVIYSVGDDGRDDGGALAAVRSRTASGRILSEDSPDWGIQIRLSGEAGAP